MSPGYSLIQVASFDVGTKDPLAQYQLQLVSIHKMSPLKM